MRKPRLVLGMFLLILGLFILLSFIDYQPQHSRFYQLMHPSSKVVGNRLGTLGVGTAFYLFRYLGCAAWFIPIFILFIGTLNLLGTQYYIRTKNVICFSLSLLIVPILFALLQVLHWVKPWYDFYSGGVGGLWGMFAFKTFFETILGSVGSGLVLFPCALIALCLSFVELERLLAFIWSSISKMSKCTVKIFEQVFEKIKSVCKPTEVRFPKFFHKISWGSIKQFLHRVRKVKEQTSVTEEKPLKEDTPLNDFQEKGCEANEPVLKTKKKSVEEIEQKSSSSIQIIASEIVEKSTDKMPVKADGYRLPELNLLKDPPPAFNEGDEEDYYETANDLVQKLAEFGVEVKVEAIQSGPVITRYEVTPARGVRVEKIATLDKNIALGLKALSVRIQAPVPGKGCVGIEVPNKKPLPVFLKEILGSKAWAQSNAEIPIVLGKEVTGKPIVADLTKMPHLLIAGSTGSGKTVCINAIIASLLFRASPKDLRFIMVDPKIVEMKIYNDLPHMLIPVVTDPKRVPSALKWLISEMERRYQLFADYGVRNIAGFNEKLKKMTLGELEERHLEHLPYIVCIVDELADLMMVAPGDIETSIARLAQLARAAGIHLIIATQRPSVNVITGIIKANLPSRIAFKVASKVDSRTILDMGGADGLIGKGDMLFIPPGASQLVRAQGAWISDDEITNLVEFLKCNGAPKFAEEVQEMIANESTDGGSSFENTSDDDDELIPQAIEVLKSSERVSTSLLQRRLKIGYNRAARIMETLEERGLVPSNFE